jgi:hypothetical protein
MNSIIILFFALILTIIIELGAVLTFQKFHRHKFPHLITLVILINCLTNPLLNVILSFIGFKSVLSSAVILSELAVFIVETLILYIAYKKEFWFFTTLSFTMNVASFSIGLILLSFF